MPGMGYKGVDCIHSRAGVGCGNAGQLSCAGSATSVVPSPSSATGSVPSRSNGIKREKGPEGPATTKVLFKGWKQS